MPTTKENSGVLFRNVDKTEGSNMPDYSGDLLLAGVGPRGETVRFRIAGWVKESSRGKFLSLSAKRDEPTAEAKPAAKKLATVDDDIPF